MSKTPDSRASRAAEAALAEAQSMGAAHAFVAVMADDGTYAIKGLGSLPVQLGLATLALEASKKSIK